MELKVSVFCIKEQKEMGEEHVKMYLNFCFIILERSSSHRHHPHTQFVAKEWILHLPSLGYLGHRMHVCQQSRHSPTKLKENKEINFRF